MCPWKVGDIVTRDGTDEHKILSIDGSLFVVECVKEPSPHPAALAAGPWTRLGQTETNVWASYSFIRSPATGLTSTATHQIPGRGTVKTCAPHELPHLGPITIDGEPMILTGIEGRAGWKPGDEIGLIVRQATDAHGHVVDVPQVNFSSLITIKSFEIKDPECGDVELHTARVLPELCEVLSDHVVLLRAEQGMKHPEYEEIWTDPEGIILKRWWQEAIRIEIDPGWKLFCAAAGKWDIRMVLVRKAAEELAAERKVFSK